VTAAYSPVATDLRHVALAQSSGGFDIVIEYMGRAESMLTAVDIAGKGGQVLLFGVAEPGNEIALRPFDVFSKELQIKGSFINPYTMNWRYHWCNKEKWM
jgi:threonine dehydrogenase-like Zn-dependent dehydrogenase